MDDRDELTRHLCLLRDQMEQLVCALDIQQLVLANQRLRWLPMVSENVESIVDDIRATEVERIATSRRVAMTAGVDRDASLAELVQAVGEPHASLWRRCRHQLISLHAEVETFSEANRILTRNGLASTGQVLRGISGDGELDTYDPHGATERMIPAASRFDRTV